MLDWISKLFGNNQKSSSPAPAPRQQPSLTQMPSMNRSAPTVDLAAQAREEERRRREEERRAQQAADAAKKAKDDAAARTKQIQDQQNQQQQAQQKTVKPLVDPTALTLPSATPVKPRAITTSPAMVQPNPKLMEMKANMDQANKNLDRSQKLAVVGGKGGLAANQTLGILQSAPKDIANTPATLFDLATKFGIGNKFENARISESLRKGVDDTLGQWRPTGGKTYNEMISDTERSRDMYMKQIYENGGNLNKLEAGGLALSEGLASLASPTEAATGLRAVSKIGRTAEELNHATGDLVGATSRGGNILRDSRTFQIAHEAERAAQDAEIAMKQLPDEVQINQQATNAGKIDDGISSPSRTEDAKSVLTQHVEQQRAEIQTNYQTQLMGLDEMRKSLMPKPLATEMAGGPVDPGMVARQAELDAPRVEPAPQVDLPVPSKQQLTQAIDTPTEVASKAAADATPAPVIKTRTMDDMTDQEVLQKFGKTREEIQASRAGLEAEKAAKAERKLSKENRQAEKKAAAEQAALDAGEAPVKDILAGKKRTVDAPVEEAPAKKLADLRDRHENASSKTERAALAKVIRAEEQGAGTPIKARRMAEAKAELAAVDNAKPSKDLFAGKKRADAPSKEPTPKQNEQATNRADFIDQKKTEKATQAENRAQFIADKKAANPDDPKLAKYEAADKKLTAKGEKQVAGYVEADKKLPGKPTKEPTPNRAADIQENAGIDPVTTEKMPKPKTEWADEHNGKAPADLKQTQANEAAAAVEAPSKDIFAGKKRTETTAKPTKEPVDKTTAESTPEAPSKTPPKKDGGILEGAAKTGEKARSTAKTATGNQTRATYETASRKGTADAANDYAKNNPVKEFIAIASKKTDVSVGDEAIAQAFIRQGRAKIGSVERGQLNHIIQSARSKAGQNISLLTRYDRKTATHHEITADYEKRFTNADLEVGTDELKHIDDLGADYTAKREAVNQAREQAIRSKDNADIDTLEKAINDAYIADRTQKTAAYDAALKAAKKAEKDGQPLSEEQFAALTKLKKDIGVFQYDAVDASLLSATGTMFNNLMNGFFGLTESVGVGKVASRIAGITHGVKVGGFSTKGMAMGTKEGYKSLTTEVKGRTVANRVGNAGPMKKLWGAYKNTVTTANELSEVNIRARIQSKTYDHYMQVNKEAGLSGKDLKAQSRIDSLTDPSEIRQYYEAEAYLTQGMSALEKSGGKARAETQFKDWISKSLNENTALGKTINGRNTSEYVSKLTSRFLIGFPSVVWRSGVVAGAKRTPGVGMVIDGVRYKKAVGEEAKARVMAEAIEHAGSAATYAGIGTFLGAAGIISGAYPTDPNEQERWQAEGRTEWSIKLGNDFYDIRKPLGAFALPLMLSAQVGQNMADGEHPFAGFIPNPSDPYSATRSPLLAIFGVTPADGPLKRVNDIVDVMKGTNGWADLAATATRMNVPAAGFINEIAKMTTSAVSHTELEARDKENQVKEFFNRLAVAVPGGGEMMGLDAKQTLGVDQTATSVIGRLFGAQKGYNPEGAAVVKAQQDNAATAAVATRSVDTDTFDKVLSTMDDDTKGLYKRLVKDGKTLAPEKQKKVDDAIAGIAKGDNYESSFGDDGDWNTQAYILSKKYDKMSKDTAVKREDVEKLDREIKRTAILEQTKGDPKIYKKYKQISQGELKKMLDNEDLDNYDPNTASLLLAMDDMFTQHGLSYNSNGDNPWTKSKYDLAAIKKSLGGRGGGGSKKLLATDVSTMKVQESEGLQGLKYKTVGDMPNIMASTPRKNFKKTISIKPGVQL